MSFTHDAETGKTTDIQSQQCFGLLGAMVIFHASVRLLTIGLSLLGLRHSPIVAMGILAVSVVAAFGFWGSGPWRKTIAAKTNSSNRAAPGLVAIVGWTIFLALFGAAYWQHDLSYDGNIYHLPTIHFWTQEGRIHWIDDHFQQAHLLNGYPKGVELLAFVAVRAFNSDNWANMSNLFFLPLGVFGITCLARLLGASKAWAAVGGALWLLTPVCILQTSTTYVDGAYGSCVVAFVASLAVVVAGLKLPNASWGWRETIVFGASAGLCLGAKSTGIAVIGLGFLVAIGFIVRRFIGRKTPSSRSTVCKAVGLIAVSAVLCGTVGGYWHVRNFLNTGSPFYPCGLTIAGRTIFHGMNVNEILGPEAQTIPDLRGLPAYQKIFHIWRQYKGWNPLFFFVDSRVGGLGYLWLLGGIPAVLILLRRFFVRRYAMNRDVFLVMIIVIGSIFLVQPMNWWPRFTVWILGLGLPCFALLADEIWNRCRSPIAPAASATYLPRKRRLAAVLRTKLPLVWIQTCLLIAVVEGGLCGLSVLTSWRRIPHNRQELAMTKTIYSMPKWKLLWPEMAGTIMERVLSGNDSIALGLYGNHPPPHENQVFFIGGLISPLGRRCIIPVQGNVDEDQIDALRQAGVSYIIWDDNYPLPPSFHLFRIEKSPGFFVVVLSETVRKDIL